MIIIIIIIIIKIKVYIQHIICESKEVLFFQPSSSNRQYCKLGAEKFFSFCTDIPLSANLRRRYIRYDCLFDSLFSTSVIINTSAAYNNSYSSINFFFFYGDDF